MIYRSKTLNINTMIWSHILRVNFKHNLKKKAFSLISPAFLWIMKIIMMIIKELNYQRRNWNADRRPDSFFFNEPPNRKFSLESSRRDYRSGKTYDQRVTLTRTKLLIRQRLKCFYSKFHFTYMAASIRQ